MIGCLIKKIISLFFTLILGLALLIFFAFGGFDYIKNLATTYLFPKPTIEQQAKKIGDFSKIPSNYKLTRVVNMFGINAVVAEDIKNTQKFAVIDPGWVLNITKNDIRANTMEAKVQEVADKFGKNQFIKLEKFETFRKGSFKAMNQNIPYVKVKIAVSGNAQQGFEGIVGVADVRNNKTNLLVSLGEPGKYRQDIAEKFFKNIKLNPNNQ